MSDDIGVMVCGHGSRDDQAIAEFAAMAAGIARRLPRYAVRSGFLEFARPIIRDGLDQLRVLGVTAYGEIIADPLRQVKVNVSLPALTGPKVTS